MIDDIKNIKLDNKSIKSFGTTFGIIFLLISLYLFFKEYQFYQYVVYFSLSFFLLGRFAPVILKPTYFLWMIFATILGWIMTRIILSVLFFFIISPIAITSKVFGKQFLQLKWDNAKNTLWNKRLTPFNKNSNLNQY